MKLPCNEPEDLVMTFQGVNESIPYYIMASKRPDILVMLDVVSFRTVLWRI